MTWAPDPDSGRVAELHERGARVFGHLATDTSRGIAVYFPRSSPVAIECWRDTLGNRRLLLRAVVEHDVNWANERIAEMLLEPSNSRVARPVRLGDRLVLMLYLPDGTDDTAFGRFVQGVTYDEAALRDRLHELDEAYER
jgi:hypothetical protein